MDDDVMNTLVVAKPVPPSLDIINIDNASATRVGHVTLTVAKLLNKNILYQATTAAPRPKRPFINNTFRTRSKVRTQPPVNNSKRSDAENSKTNGEAEQSSTAEEAPPAPTVNVPKKNIYWTWIPVDSMHFYCANKAAYTLL